MIHFKQSGSMALLTLQVMLYIVVVVTIFVLRGQVASVREATGRQTGKSEKIMRTQLNLFLLMMSLAFIAGVSYGTDTFSSETIKMCLYFHLTWIAFSFPLLFGLSTKHFQSIVKKIFVLKC